MFTIDYPFIFMLFPIILGIWYFLDIKNLGQKSPNIFLKKYFKNPYEKKFIWIFRCFISLFITAIFCNINFVYTFTKKFPEPYTHIIVLDISRSMLAEDMDPNRMIVAKNAIKNFVQLRKEDNFTLIIFAGKAFTTISNTNDQNGILAFLDNISPNYILQEKPWLSGTNIWDTLLLALQEGDKINNKKSIILLTDGSANIGSNPLESASIAKNSNTKIYTIGIGLKNWQPLSYTDQNGQKNFFYDANGEKLITDLDEDLLINIANTTWGKYFTAENITKLNIAFQETNANIGNNFIEKTITQKIAITPILILLLIISIFWENYFRKKMYTHYNILK